MAHTLRAARASCGQSAATRLQKHSQSTCLHLRVGDLGPSHRFGCKVVCGFAVGSRSLQLHFWSSDAWRLTSDGAHSGENSFVLRSPTLAAHGQVTGVVGSGKHRTGESNRCRKTCDARRQTGECILRLARAGQAQTQAGGNFRNLANRCSQR